MKILITGAAGNLGSLLSKFILDYEKDLNLILMQHRTKVPDDIRNNPRVKVKSINRGAVEQRYSKKLTELPKQLVVIQEKKELLHYAKPLLMFTYLKT